MNKGIILLLIFATFSWGQVEPIEVQEFPIQDYLQKVGNLQISNTKGTNKIVQEAQKVFIQNIQDYLKAQKTLQDLHHIEIVDKHIKVYGFRKAIEDVKHYLSHIDEHIKNRFIIKVRMVTLRLEDIKKVSWLKARAIDQMSPFPNFTANIIPIQLGEEELKLAALQSVQLQDKSSPGIVISENFINKLVFSSRNKAHYIQDYQTIQLPNGTQQNIAIAKELNRSFSLWLLPQLKTDKKILLHAVIDALDYKEPVKEITTTKGVIHKPAIQQQTSSLVFNMRLPGSVCIALGPNYKNHVYLLFLSLEKPAQQDLVVKGRVLGKIERNVVGNQQVKLPAQYLLETGTMPALKFGLKVTFQQYDKVVGKGKIISVLENSCIVEVEQQDIDLTKTTFFVHQ